MEYWDVYDADGNFTGKSVEKGSIFLPGEYHLAIELWIVNSKKEILIQKRSEQCALLPGVWALTTGRLLSGESSLSGCIREAKEELGISIDESQLVFLRRLSLPAELIWDIYAFKSDIASDFFALQSSEVSEVKWVSSETFYKMIENGDLFYYPEIFSVLSQVISLV